MEQVRKNQIAQGLIAQMEDGLEASTMLARVCERCGDKQGHEQNKAAAILLEKKIAELKKEIEETKKEA